MGLGNGISGAAFLKRVIVPWAKGYRTGFVKPILEENPDDLKAILAVPLYHPEESDQEMPSSWGTIGVVCFSSSSPACKIPRLLNEVPSGKEREMMNMLWVLAKILVHQMFMAFSEGNPLGTAKN